MSKNSCHVLLSKGFIEELRLKGYTPDVYDDLKTTQHLPIDWMEEQLRRYKKEIKELKEENSKTKESLFNTTSKLKLMENQVENYEKHMTEPVLITQLKRSRDDCLNQMVEKEMELKKLRSCKTSDNT